MDDQVLAIILSRLDRLEAKVDRLMSFRAYLVGIGTVCGLIGSWIYSHIRGY